MFMSVAKDNKHIVRASSPKFLRSCSCNVVVSQCSVVLCRSVGPGERPLFARRPMVEEALQLKKSAPVLYMAYLAAG